MSQHQFDSSLTHFDRSADILEPFKPFHKAIFFLLWCFLSINIFSIEFVQRCLSYYSMQKCIIICRSCQHYVCIIRNFYEYFERYVDWHSYFINTFYISNISFFASYTLHIWWIDCDVNIVNITNNINYINNLRSFLLMEM